MFFEKEIINKMDFKGEIILIIMAKFGIAGIGIFEYERKTGIAVPLQ